jgi:hypothetical protein
VKHIKTPVWIDGPLIVEDGEAVSSAMCRVYPGHLPPDHADVQAREIRDVLNAHDDLIAERDELKAQRDALVEACEALMAWIGPPPTDRYSYDSVREEGWGKARAALALVKKEE